jgi:HEAT repeat protein
MAAAILLVVSVALQGPGPESPQDPKELLEKLRSENIDERETAARRLKELGVAALPVLEAAAKDPDSEVAERARLLLRIIEIRMRLSPDLRRQHPGLEDRLAGSNPRVWTETYLALTLTTKTRTPDLEFLADRALSGARPYERAGVISSFGLFGLDRTAPLLVPFLRSADRDLAHYAAVALASMESKEARQAVETLFKDPLAVQRGLGCQAVMRPAGIPFQPLVVSLLADPDPEVRRLAIQTLQYQDARERTGEILPLLRDPVPRVRRAAAEGLGAFDCREQVPTLLPLLRDPQPGVREIVVHTLALLQAHAAAPQMVELLADPSEEVRTAAAWFLLLMNRPEASTNLLPLLQSRDSDSRAVAAVALGRFSARQALPGLARLLVDDDEEVRAAAAWSMGMLKSLDHRQALLKLLQDPSREVRAEACGAVAAVGAREAVPALLKQLADPKLRGSALMALERLSGQEALPELLKLLAMDDQDFQEEVALALRSFPPMDVLGGLRTLAARPEVPSRQGAARAFRALAARETQADLRRLLKDSDEDVQSLAAETLGAIGAEDSIPELLVMVKETKGLGRLGAIQGLGWLRSKRAVPTLREILLDGSRMERHAASQALERMGATEVFQEAASRLNEFWSDTSFVLAAWMSREGRREGVPVLLDLARTTTALNALRNPEGWRKLAAVEIPDGVEGTWLELADRVVQGTGLHVEWRFEYPEAEVRWLLERHRLRGPGRTMTGARALEALVELTDGDYDAIVEGDVVRLVPTATAARFWKKWWHDETRGK